MKPNLSSKLTEDALLVGLREHEKRVFAKQLHEGVLQTLSAASILARVVAKRAKAPVLGLSEFARLQELIDAAIDEARLLIRQIQGPGTEKKSLIAALQELADSTGRRCPCLFKHHLRTGRPLAATATAALLRIAQEAIWAALQRRKVSQISIILTASLKVVHLEVRDNGRSSEQDQMEDGAWSSLVLQAHARLTRGQLTVSSDKDGNTVSYTGPTDSAPRVHRAVHPNSKSSKRRPKGRMPAQNS